MPASTVRMPSRVAVIGPIVDPHGTALFDTKSCEETPACSHQPDQAAADEAWCGGALAALAGGRDSRLALGHQAGRDRDEHRAGLVHELRTRGRGEALGTKLAQQGLDARVGGRLGVGVGQQPVSQ